MDEYSVLGLRQLNNFWKNEFADRKKIMQFQKTFDPKMSCNSNMLVVLREQYASLHTIPWAIQSYRYQVLQTASLCFGTKTKFFCKPDLRLTWPNNSTYRIVGSASPSLFEAHVGLFRFLMKGIFDPYVLWPFTTLWYILP